MNKIEYGVEVGQIDTNVIDHVRNSPGSETMLANVGEGIKEHKHTKSLYFAKNANLTLNGKVYKVNKTFFALIPKNVAHGWQHTGGRGQAVITSFEEGHKNYETYDLN
ncbi:hypothetical protein HOA92_02310 [archaeon]|jgi:hypothetical protein|nr:hypothetical protein [archaeon]